MLDETKVAMLLDPTFRKHSSLGRKWNRLINIGDLVPDPAVYKFPLVLSNLEML